MEREGLTSLIDWLQFTLPIGSNLQTAYEVLGIEESEFKEMPRGLLGYAKHRACGEIKVLSEGKLDMGVHVLMSGQACREYETYHADGWEPLLSRIFEADGRTTRFDLAVDERRYKGEKPFFTLRQMISKVKRDECKSKFKKARRIETIRIEGGRSEGQTIYFGSAFSDIQFRVYEKDYERENAGKENEAHLTTWNRFELQMRDERAQAAVMAILSGISSGRLVFGIMSNYVDFLDRQRSDSNKARWPRTKWWDDFLASAEKLRLAKQAPDKTIDRKREWMEKQVTPTFAQLFISSNYSQEFLVEMVERGLQNMSEAQMDQAELYLEKWKDEQRKKRVKQAEKARELGLAPDYFGE